MFTRGSMIFLMCLITAGAAFGALQNSPFGPDEDRRFDSIESLSDTDGIELASAKIIVGDASGNGNAVAMSGDATISNAGVVTMANNAVILADIALTNGNIIVGDASTNAVDVTMSGDATIVASGALTIAANAVGTSEVTDGTLTEADMIVQTADGLHLKRVARAVLDCGSSDCSVGTVSMVQALPATAIITQVYYYIVTQFVDGGSGTVALHCEDANNILTAGDITGISGGVVTTGAAIGTAGTMVASIASACTITATIATAEQTAGVLVLFVEYVVAQ